MTRAIEIRQGNAAPRPISYSPAEPSPARLWVIEALLDLLWAMRPTISPSTASVRRFAIGAAERTNYPNHVVEMALAHAIGDAVEKAYPARQICLKSAGSSWRRGQQFLAKPLPAEGAKVVRLRG